MASIVKRNKRFCVVYTYTAADGTRKQKWETYETLEKATQRKTEVEFQSDVSNFIVPECKTVNQLLKEFVNIYGKSNWSASTYSSNTGLIRRYISPIIGDMNLKDITARVLEKYYMALQNGTAAVKKNGKKETIQATAGNVKRVHALLRSSFNQAVKWELMEKNPALNATVPKVEYNRREIWDAPTLFQALEVCENPRLKMAMNLSFACSLRMGEVLALTWDCVDISSDSIKNGRASICVTKELQRVDKKVLEQLEGKDVIFRFPEQIATTKTVLVLKTPKTASSVRKVFLPTTVARMLVTWKEEQESVKQQLGSEYRDYNLVMASPTGTPTEARAINKALKNLIRENNLPEVVFHSFRHTSITYKLKLNGGDIKAVQGDSGHAQAKMVTDQYSHILDEGRVENAHLIEEAFYEGHAEEKAEPAADPDNTQETQQDAEALQQLLSNPALITALKNLLMQA